MEIGRHRSMIANAHIKIGSNSYEKMKTFKYLGSLLTNQKRSYNVKFPKAQIMRFGFN